MPAASDVKLARFDLLVSLLMPRTRRFFMPRESLLWIDAKRGLACGRDKPGAGGAGVSDRGVTGAENAVMMPPLKIREPASGPRLLLPSAVPCRMNAAVDGRAELGVP